MIRVKFFQFIRCFPSSASPPSVADLSQLLLPCRLEGKFSVIFLVGFVQFIVTFTSTFIRLFWPKGKCEKNTGERPAMVRVFFPWQFVAQVIGCVGSRVAISISSSSSDAEASNSCASSAGPLSRLCNPETLPSHGQKPQRIAWKNHQNAGETEQRGKERWVGQKERQDTR